MGKIGKRLYTKLNLKDNSFPCKVGLKTSIYPQYNVEQCSANIHSAHTLITKMLCRISAVVILAFIITCNCLLLDSLEYRNCSAALPFPEEKSKIDLSQDEAKFERDQGLSRDGCPPWFTNETGECLPGPTLGGIVQHDLLTLQTSLLECYCMTEEDGSLVVGACMYTCKVLMGYYPLPCHVSQLENFTCTDLHRHGKLCGQCEDGYAIPVYSYDLACVKCENYAYNWLKYVAVAFVPLTLFYILVTLSSISFTSPLLSGLVMTFEILGHPIQAEMFLSLVKSDMILIEPNILKVLLSIASLWNLDFFRLYYSFCLHPDASAMTIMALDYATTVYPVILIGVTYVMVQLYDHNFKLLVWPWKLLSVILKPLRRCWNVKTSLVDVFASFIYLSSTRLLLTSINFLIPIRTFTYQQGPDGQMKFTTAYYLLNSPSMEYFDRNHLPFALMAITLSILFFVLPMILLFVYPFTCFQRTLNKTGLNSLTLRTFVEVFQGPFKDGTNNTRDYRYFSGCILLVPLILCLTFSLTHSSMYYPVASVWILIYLTLHLVFQPYKRSLHNYITIAMFAALLTFYWSMIMNSEVVAVRLIEFLSLEYIYPFSGVWMLSIVLFVLSIVILFSYFLGLGMLTILRVCNVRCKRQ